MRHYELYLFAILFIQFFLANPRNKGIVISNFIGTGLSIILVFLQVIDEGYRWQVIPLYFVAVMYVLHAFFLFFSWTYQIDIKPTRIYIRTTYAVLLIIGFFLPVFFPVSFNPGVSGEYSVGTRHILLTDSSRVETFSPIKNDVRNVPLQVWYPCIPGEAKKSHYWNNSREMSRAWTKSNGISFLPFLWDHLGYLETNSFLDAEIKKDSIQYPVLIFSHGYWQCAQFNIFLMEELASQGFVVISISHEYETCLSVYPNDSLKVFTQNNDEFQKRMQEDNKEEIGIILSNIAHSQDSAEQTKLWQEFYGLMPKWMESNNIWVSDVQFVIDQIEEKKLDGIADVIDNSKIGVFGFSFGGGVAGLATLQDERIKACVNMDGYQYGHNLRKNFNVPTMFVLSEGHQESAEYFLKRAEAPFYSLTIEKSRHTNFNDLAILAEFPLKIIGRLRNVPSRSITYITYHYVVDFFNEYLRNVKSDLLGNPEFYEEVKIKTNQ